MKINLKMVYDDDEITVFIAPDEKETEEIIKRMLAERAMTTNEIHEALSNLASDDKIRKILRKLMQEGKVEMDNRTKRFRLIS